MRPKPGWTEERLQRLFDDYNRRYWRGRLPRYNVVISDTYWGSACDRRNRQVFFHPVVFERSSERQVRETLLHEMAHAATPGVHSKAWYREMKRLHRLGAPVDASDLTMDFTASYEVIFDEFEEHGWDSPSMPWKETLRRLAYRMGLVTGDLKPVSKSAARLLPRCRTAFLRGARWARKNQPAITRASRRIAKQQQRQAVRKLGFPSRQA